MCDPGSGHIKGTWGRAMEATTLEAQWGRTVRTAAASIFEQYLLPRLDEILKEFCGQFGQANGFRVVTTSHEFDLLDLKSDSGFFFHVRGNFEALSGYNISVYQGDDDLEGTEFLTFTRIGFADFLQWTVRQNAGAVLRVLGPKMERVMLNR